MKDAVVVPVVNSDKQKNSASAAAEPKIDLNSDFSQTFNASQLSSSVKSSTPKQQKSLATTTSSPLKTVNNFIGATVPVENSSTNDKVQHSQLFGVKSSKIGNGKYVGNDSGAILLDSRIIFVFLAFAVFVISYKILIVTMPYAKTESLSEYTKLLQTNYKNLLDWANEKEVHTILNPVLCGLAFALFSFVVVYFDSSEPGVNPPTPFSPRSKQRYQRQMFSFQLNYMTALASGVVVALLLYCNS